MLSRQMREDIQFANRRLLDLNHIEPDTPVGTHVRRGEDVKPRWKDYSFATVTCPARFVAGARVVSFPGRPSLAPGEYENETVVLCFRIWKAGTPGWIQIWKDPNGKVVDGTRLRVDVYGLPYDNVSEMCQDAKELLNALSTTPAGRTYGRKEGTTEKRTQISKDYCNLRTRGVPTKAAGDRLERTYSTIEGWPEYKAIAPSYNL